ncbi:MAG TPA: DUF4032 domain-containing protein [Anaerolineae bacterium]|nr:DUF4032 domain-containing protein [Anaerolineae bacterium]
MSLKGSVRQKAEEAFTQARRRAFVQRIWHYVTRQPEDGLLSFDQVRDKLSIRGQHYVGLRSIPIEKVVGTVGRYQEFNRAFLPTQEHIRERWKRVYEAAHGSGLPPIDVYKIGEVYFVRDGHHRVSVLKELGAPTIEALVTELDTPVSLAADVDVAQLALKSEYASFLRQTRLDQLRPQQDLIFTLPGQYQKLLEHVAVHRYFLGMREQREIPEREAVARWYDEIYLPMVALIRDEGILDEFPERTEADLYMWVIEHRHHLSEHFGGEVPFDQAAAQFSRSFATGAGRKQLEERAAHATDGGGQRSTWTGTIAVFGSGRAPVEHEVLRQAERLGELLAEAGFTVMCGGYGGTMEAVSRGAQQAGGETVGVTMDLFTARLQPNAWLTKEQRVKDFFPRLRRLTEADGFVVLRGGIGTLTEASLTWSLLQTGQIAMRPFVFVGDSWRRVFDCLRAETFMAESDFALATVVQSVEEAVGRIKEALAPSP